MTDPQLLRIAAEYLRRQGWQTGSMGGNGHPACLVGALYESVAWKDNNGSVVYDAARVEQLRQHLRAHPRFEGRSSVSLVLWNDAYGRTREDVMALLVETAQALEEGNSK